MENQDNRQLELFARDSREMRPWHKEQKKPFFAAIRGYEKALLAIIGIIVIGIVSFSMGVEKGKRLSLRSNSRLDLAAEAVIKPAKVTAQRPVAPAVITRDAAGEQAKEGYTIQLASYRSKSHAEKEAQALKKKGFSTLVMTKGQYVVLCVGNFSSKENARTMLSQMERKYKGCYIRRL